MQNLKQRIYTFIMLFFTSFSVLAVPASPKYVYRFDTRPPVTIFEQGFRSWGTNNSLLQHVHGASLRRESLDGSAFVATTSDINIAINLGRILARVHGPTYQFYVYRIRADQSFYSVPMSLEYCALHDYRYVDARDRFSRQQEYASHGGIRREQVESATRYYMADGVPVENGVEYNPSYQDSTTVANPEPYPDVIPYDSASRYTPAFECAIRENRTDRADLGLNIEDATVDTNQEDVKFYENMKSCYEKNMMDFLPIHIEL
ncbi:hypothetical protein MRM75_06285 [bacterium 19CA06SA08-2]|uniref:Pertussis toxin subunit 1 n=1 Tax=bacterium 19CA06SA08-2 TaxID=2920658 RepID=A0AAU6U8F9_UNCXX